jgi:O-antigen/teichoic acid export membrane protein
VVEAAKVREVCPACGVPRKMMEAWKDPVSDRRRLILGFDIHPIILHFSITFVASAFVLALVALLFPALFADAVTQLLQALLGVLPLAVIGSFLSGLFDGKIRFRRTTTPILTRKKLLAGAFFLLSAAAAALSFFVGPDAEWVRIVNVLLLAAGVFCAGVLARLGRGILNSAFPG